MSCKNSKWIICNKKDNKGSMSFTSLFVLLLVDHVTFVIKNLVLVAEMCLIWVF